MFGGFEDVAATIAKADPALAQSPPEAFTAVYARLRDVPPDVLADRLISDLMQCEGDLVRAHYLVTKFVIATRTDAAAP